MKLVLKHRKACTIIILLIIAAMIVTMVAPVFAAETVVQPQAKTLDELISSTESATSIASAEASNQPTTVSFDSTQSSNTVSQEQASLQQSGVSLSSAVPIITLGEDLTPEQKATMLSFFGDEASQAQVITVSHTDEAAYLNGIATPDQIGTHTYSCTYIQPTTDGGIHVKTVNLDWVTADMIRNCLITCGIYNCNIVAASPTHVSGTGALTGIFKAYSLMQANSETSDMTPEKQELAAQELVTTVDLAKSISQNNASTMVSDLKEQVIEDKNIVSSDQIATIVDNYCTEHNIQLTPDQKQKLVDLLWKIKQQNYNIDKIKKDYEIIKQDLAQVQEGLKRTQNLFEKIVSIFKHLFNIADRTASYTDEKLGIIDNLNENALSGNVVTTGTDGISSNEIINKGKEAAGHWYDFIIKVFNAGNASEVSTEASTETATQVIQ